MRLQPRHPLSCLLLLVPLGLNAGCAPDASHPLRTIQIVGRGVALAPPKGFRVSASVYVDHPNAEQAVLTMSAISAQMLEAARHFLADAADVKTEDLALEPEYERQTQKLLHFTARQHLTIFLRDHQRAGQLLGALVKAGATRVSMEFDVEDRQALERAARLAGLEDARRHARVMAEAYGDRAGRALRIGCPGEGGFAANLFQDSDIGTNQPEDTIAVTLKAPDRIEIEATIPVLFELLP